MATDILTRLIFSIDNPIVTGISLILDSFTYYVLLGIFLYVLFVRDKRLEMLKTRIKVLFVTSLLLIAAVQFLKVTFNQQRPCADAQIMKAVCPEDGSFPSGHATFTAAFLPFLIGTPWLWPFFLFHLMIALSRVYLGLHTIIDVSAGAMLGVAMYLIIQRLMIAKEDDNEGKKRKR